MSRAINSYIDVPFSIKGSDKSHTIRIPNEIVSAFNLISEEEKQRIDDSRGAAIAQQWKDNIGSQELRNIWNDNFPETPFKYDGLAGSYQIIQNFLMEAPAEISWNTRGNPKAKEQALRLMQLNCPRVLNSKGISRILLDAVHQAVVENDVDFFRSLGRCLSVRPKKLKIWIQLNTLQELMIWHWIGGDSKVIFCCFTDQALTDFLAKVSSAGTTLDAVSTTRKRLKLKQVNKLLVRRVSQEKGLIFLA